ncbi:MAG: hydrogenase maturation factor [Lachnospiraceae bacterium]|nr:hydrogenase maturation factor [Lachnospiraceae bacterium]
MKTGKLSETILKRSVIKQLRSNRKEVLQGAAVGCDCAFFSCRKEGMSVASVTTAVVHDHEAMTVVTAAANNIAAGGGSPAAVLVAAVFPKEAREAEIKELTAEVESACSALGIQVAGGDVRISSQVKKTVLTVTVLGYAKAEETSLPGKCRPGQDVVMSKWIALQGTALAAARREQELIKRFPVYMVEEAKAFASFVSVIPEAAIAVKSGVSRMHDVSGGGIFAALWELAEGADVGLEIEGKEIPIRQETVEICEFLGLNPYELLGGGALLMICDNGRELVHKLKKEGIPAAIIGVTTDKKDRVILRDGERRYLNRPGGEELEK